MSEIYVKVTLPTKPGLDTAVLERELRVGIDKLLAISKTEFGYTYATFVHKPVFKACPAVSKAGTTSGKVFTRDENYIRLDEGTRPHTITARRVPFLSYQANFTPKTRPRVLIAFPGGKYGKKGVKRKSVRHPGFKPRYFAETVAARHRNDLDPIAKAAVKAASK